MIKHKFLIIIDMQNDFVTGPLGTPEALGIIPYLKDKLKAAEDGRTTVIFTRDTHFDNYSSTLEGKMLPTEHCKIDTNGWEIIPELNTHKAKILNKFTFADRYFAEELADCYDFSAEEAEIELCGVCTDICVVSTALMLRSFLPNVKIKVDSKCCAGTTPKKHKAALDVMKSCQIEVLK